MFEQHTSPMFHEQHFRSCLLVAVHAALHCFRHMHSELRLAADDIFERTWVLPLSWHRQWSCSSEATQQQGNMAAHMLHSRQ